MAKLDKPWKLGDPNSVYPDLNPVIKQIYATGTVEDAEGNSISCFPTSLTRERGVPLYQLVRKTRPAKTLEVGMAYGLSTLYMCQALQDNGGGVHTAIDPSERKAYQSIGLLNLRKAGLHGFLRLIEAPSDEALPQLLASGERFAVIFIDGSHLFDHALVDLYFADKLLEPGGFVMVDDLWMPAVRKACVFMLRNRTYRLATEYVGSRPALWQSCFRFARSLGQDPWSFHSIYYAAVFASAGFLKFCIMQKMGDGDQRSWHHYKAF